MNLSDYEFEQQYNMDDSDSVEVVSESISGSAFDSTDDKRTDGVLAISKLIKNDKFPLSKTIKNMRSGITFVLLEFIEVFVHQVLYYRNVYPDEMFGSVQKYKLELRMCSSQLPKDYLIQSFEKLESTILHNELESLRIEILDTNEETIEETYIIFASNNFDRLINKRNFEGIVACENICVELQSCFQVIIAKLIQEL